MARFGGGRAALAGARGRRATFPGVPGSQDELFEDVFESTGTFADFIAENNEAFTDVDLGRLDPSTSLTTLDTAEAGFLDIASGTDPVIEAQRRRALGENAENFARRGTGGSSAAANQALRVGGRFDEQQLSNRNAGLAGLLQTSGQRFGIEQGAAGFNNLATGQELGFLQQAFENAELEPALLLDLLNIASSGTEEDFDFFGDRRREEEARRNRPGSTFPDRSRFDETNE